VRLLEATPEALRYSQTRLDKSWARYLLSLRAPRTDGSFWRTPAAAMNRTSGDGFRAGPAFTGLWIVGLGAFTAWPVIASLYYSFCDYSILKSPVWSGLENYRELIHDDLFWKSLRNTLFYAGSPCRSGRSWRSPWRYC
jgi:ABC-type Fe3+ transport system permease subunit